MEIEAKFRATEPITVEAVEAVDLRPYSFGPCESFHFHDTLFDTPLGTLQAQRVALRVRHDGAVYFLTLKKGGGVEGSVHTRDEWEQPLLSADPYDPTTWPAPVREQLAQWVPIQTLQPTLTLRNHRRAWAVFRDGQRVAEVALDEGTFHAGGRTEPFHELEIELKEAGTATHLAALTARLVEALPLTPEPRSKSQRAYALLVRDA